MLRDFNTYNLLSMDDEQVKDLLAEVHFQPTCYITSSGHGWNTGGKRSFDGTLRENQYNSIVEAKIAVLCYLLQEKGLPIEVRQVATDHYDVPLHERVRREHEFFEEFHRTHLVLGHDIHADAFSSSSANGTTTFHFKGSKAALFAEVTQDNLIQRTQLKNRGVRDANFKMLRDTKAPWILTEAAFMTNPREKELLKSDGFRNINAMAHVDSLLETVVLHYKQFLG
jgi:N-acetylmuramoyl-L-alanine amidase